MTVDTLQRIDIERLAQPTHGDDPAGPWLGYERVYDELKAARAQDADYLPQGVWQRAVKRPEWETLVARAAEALAAESKDLQIAAWLAEGLTHLEGPAGLARGLDVMARLAADFWDGLHPRLDPDDGEEPRLLVLQWCDKHLPKGLLATAVTQPGSRLDESFTLLDWDALDRRPADPPQEKPRGRRRGRGGGEAAEAEDSGPRMAELTASAQLTPRSFYDARLAAVADARRALDGLRETFNARCGPGAARLSRLEATLDRLAEKLEEARGLLDDAEPAAGSEAGAPEAPTPGGTAEVVPVPSARARKREAPPPRDLPREIAAIEDRDAAYRVLAAVGERLIALDPHSPAPYLARRAAAFRDYTFTDLVMLLVDDDRQRQHLFRLLGIQEDDPAEAGQGGGGRGG